MKLKLAFVILMAIYCLTKVTQAQNLLYNGSFEDCDCPTNVGKIENCRYWSIPNKSTPDLFKKCSASPLTVNVPVNFVGNQEPYQGDAYVGIILFYRKLEYQNYREYLQGELMEMEPNSNYKISFYISWADRSKFFCDRIGYLFSANKIDTKHYDQKKKRIKDFNNTIIERSDGFVSVAFEQIKDRGSWHKVEFVYKAKGGEKFITLGLFGDSFIENEFDLFVNKAGLSDQLSPDAYNYFDHISIEKIDFTHQYVE